jgi:glycosyltransferase 2 family protein
LPPNNAGACASVRPVTDTAAVQAPGAGTGSGRRWRLVAVGVIRVGFTIAVLAAVTYAVVRQWPAVRHTLASLAWPSVLLSLLMVLVGLGAQTLAWRAALADLGHRVTVRTASQVYLIGLLAKYLPGSVWSYALQMELGRRANLPRSRSFLAALVVLALSTTSAVVLGVFGLPALARLDPVTKVLVFALVPAAVVGAHPRVLTWLVQRFLRLVRRPPLERPITWRAVGVVLAWCTVSWLAFGVHLWLLASTQAVAGPGALLRCVGAIALALTAGIFAFVSPSGLGVREAVLTAALLPYVPPGVALAMALASRMIFTVGDLVAAGLAALGGVRLPRSRTGV